VKITTQTPPETEHIGALLGALLTRGDIIALSGELGTGKTTLVRGIAAGMGLEATEVASPSFTLVNVYEGPLPLFHLDLYRLEDEKELFNIDFEEYMRGDGVTVIEWADKIPNAVPHESLWITVRYLETEGREIVLRPQADHYEMMIDELQKKVYNERNL
jgi:tRNA threonylcarbamoyladenosine biosynthesis protein TsaE